MAYALVSRLKGATGAPVKAGRRNKLARHAGLAAKEPGRGALAHSRIAALAPMPVLHTELKIGAPNDRFEQEAERVADRVMRMPCGATMAAASAQTGGAPRTVQRMCDECAEDEMPSFQRTPLSDTFALPRISAANDSIVARFSFHNQAAVLRRRAVNEQDTLRTKAAAGAPPDVLADLEGGVHALRGRGQPLSSDERAFFEPRFGHDFGQVRVHTDPHAVAAACALRARAFTLGRNIVFNAGEYVPNKATGQRLLAHELTHVVQQSFGTPRRLIQRAPSVIGWTFNTATLSSDNCCRNKYLKLGPNSQFYPSRSGMYPSLQKTVTNGMELKAIIADHAADASYDVKRTIERNSWQRDSVTDPWDAVPRQHKPSGTTDDPDNDDECLTPIPQPIVSDTAVAVYSTDHPGLNPDTLQATATQGVYKASFTESVEIKDATGTRIDPRGFDWHSVTWLDKDANGNWSFNSSESKIAPGAIAVAAPPRSASPPPAPPPAPPPPEFAP